MTEPLADDASSEQLLARALQEWQTAIDAGLPLTREELLHKYAAVRADLSGCLDGLHLIQQIAAQVSDRDEDGGAKPIPPVSLGDFHILRELGRGGMGVVYEAQQLSLGRRVALKILPFAAMLDKRQLARFQNEARAAATLEHPHIVPVYAVGEDRGVHYYAMRLIRGASLAEMVAALRQSRDKSQETRAGEESVVSRQSSVAKKTPPTDHGQLTTDQPQSEICNQKSEIETVALAALSTEYTHNPKRYFRRVAEIGIQVAQGLHHAHEHGILHRDVKPANILLDADGKAWITDFGLARLETDASVTHTGDLVGTLRYMSPEQAAGASPVDARADVYSLGAALYELTALRPAFTGQSREALFKQIALDPPPPLRKAAPDVPAELETIIHKTLEKEAVDRYATAAAVAEDLRRYLDHKPLHARPPSLFARTRKWSRRHRAVVATAVTILVLALAASTIVVTRAYRSERQHREAAEAAQIRAEEGLALARRAVNQMYTRVATTWLAEETAASLIQQDLLTQALTVYEQLARQPIVDAGSRREVATAHERVGEIQHFLGRPREAAEALQKAVDLDSVGMRIAEAPDETLIALAARRRKLSQVYDALAEWDSARQAHGVGLHYALVLADRAPTSGDHRFELALNHIRASEIADREARLEEAERLIDRAAEELAPLAREDGKLLDRQVAHLKAQLLQAHVIRRLGRTGEALEKGTQILRRVGYLQTIEGFHDARELTQLEAEALEALAETALDMGQPLVAADHLRAALDRKRENLKGQRSPVQLIVSSFFNREVGFEANFEQVPFCSYTETQLRLAQVLRTLDRPYEAEKLLGECILAGNVLCANSADHDLRAMLAYGHAWSEAADLLAASRPEEAENMRRAADFVWMAVAAHFPQAVDHPALLPSARQQIAMHCEQGAAHRPERQVNGYIHLPQSPAWDTPFIHHALGLSWYQAKNWESAIESLKRAANLRTAGRSYDWLYIAMAYHQLGNHEEARRWLDQATEAIGDTANPELVGLRDDAGIVVAQNAAAPGRAQIIESAASTGDDNAR